MSLQCGLQAAGWEGYIRHMGLRLASYNVHKCVGTDRRRDPGRVIDVLNALDADILALQEVDRRLPPRPAALPPDLLQSHSDFTALPFALTEEGLGWHGQALLVRGEHKMTALKRVILPGLEPRGAVMAELELPQGQLRVVGVHLGLLRRYRLMQMRAIRAAMSKRPAMQTVILGDFNEWSTRGGMGPLTDLFRIHAPGRSFHATRPVAALDRMALTADLHLRDAGVLQTPLARVASDHLPIWADIRIGSSEAAG